METLFKASTQTKQHSRSFSTMLIRPRRCSALESDFPVVSRPCEEAPCDETLCKQEDLLVWCLNTTRSRYATCISPDPHCLHNTVVLGCPARHHLVYGLMMLRATVPPPSPPHPNPIVPMCAFTGGSAHAICHVNSSSNCQADGFAWQPGADNAGQSVCGLSRSLSS